jgi:hypothetical protein
LNRVRSSKNSPISSRITISCLRNSRSPRSSILGGFSSLSLSLALSAFNDLIRLKSANQIDDPQERFLAVTKFYLSGWHVRPKGVRTALNPIIGETFMCKWRLEDSESEYVAEQISHHPPHTAFCWYNRQHRISCHANLIPSYAKFSGNSANSQIKGKMVLRLEKYKEEYEITFPAYTVRGLIFGKLVLEITGKTQIVCPAQDMIADIEFKSKGYIRGTYNSLAGRIRKGLKKTSKQLFSLSGEWDGQLVLRDDTTKESKIFIEPDKQRALEKQIVPPEETPGPLPSRKFVFSLLDIFLFSTSFYSRHLSILDIFLFSTSFYSRHLSILVSYSFRLTSSESGMM